MNKIFIIEDDLNILYGMRDIFASNDYEVEISDSNEELDDLLGKIKKLKPDVIILDIVLPKLDGSEIVKKIKEDDSTNNAEIFIFTDLSDEDGRTRSVGLGANYYFMKNEFDIYSFSNKVMRVMSRGEKNFSEDNQDDTDGLVMD